MKPHTVTSEELKDWIAEEQWHTFASAFAQNENKKLQVSVGNLKKRVLHGKWIVYEGYLEEKAVEIYNGLVGLPIMVDVKFDN